MLQTIRKEMHKIVMDASTAYFLSDIEADGANKGLKIKGTNENGNSEDALMSRQPAVSHLGKEDDS